MLFGQRMSDVDIEAVLAEEQPFEDTTFNANVASILDLNMDHSPRTSWENFTWKRPSEVYEEGKYTLFDQISPSDV